VQQHYLGAVANKILAGNSLLLLCLRANARLVGNSYVSCYNNKHFKATVDNVVTKLKSSDGQAQPTSPHAPLQTAVTYLSI